MKGEPWERRYTFLKMERNCSTRDRVLSIIKVKDIFNF